MQNSGVAGNVNCISFRSEAQMEAIAFDTHKYVKRLTAAGMPEPQAEAIADEQRALIEGQLATKRDLKEMDNALRHDLEGLRRDMKEMETGLRRDLEGLRRDMKEMETGLRHDMKEMEQKLTIRLGGMLVAGIAAVAALVELL